MSARPIRKSSTLVALLVILALLLPVSSSSSAALPSLAPAGATPPAGSPPPPAPTTGQRPLAELLQPDGTLDLNSGYRGSLDPTGWRLAGDAAAPRFVPATAPAASGASEYFVKNPSAKTSPEDIAEGRENVIHIMEFAMVNSTYTLMTELIISMALVLVREDFVRLGSFLESLLCFSIAGIFVRMVLQSLLPVSLLDLPGRRGLVYYQNFVIVSLCCHRLLFRVPSLTSCFLITNSQPLPLHT